MRRGQWKESEWIQTDLESKETNLFVNTTSLVKLVVVKESTSVFEQQMDRWSVRSSGSKRMIRDVIVKVFHDVHVTSVKTSGTCAMSVWLHSRSRSRKKRLTLKVARLFKLCGLCQTIEIVGGRGIKHVRLVDRRCGSAFVWCLSRISHQRKR